MNGGGLIGEAVSTTFRRLVGGVEGGCCTRLVFGFAGDGGGGIDVAAEVMAAEVTAAEVVAALPALEMRVERRSDIVRGLMRLTLKRMGMSMQMWYSLS